MMVWGFTQGSAGRATLGWMIESFQDSNSTLVDGIARFTLRLGVDCPHHSIVGDEAMSLILNVRAGSRHIANKVGQPRASRIVF